jgi:dTDP-4-dehydrorhamnose 3,5-epimerase
MNPPKIVRHPDILGLKTYEIDAFKDHRGCNFEIYNQTPSERAHFSLDSCSMSSKDVLRGFHGDTLNYKLIQCLSGRIQFFVIDLHSWSKTYLNVKEFILDAENPVQVLVPPHVVNAHLCLSDKCTFYYKWSHGYVPIEKQIHVKWNDPRFKNKVNWMTEKPILSERDA